MWLTERLSVAPVQNAAASDRRRPEKVRCLANSQVISCAASPLRDAGEALKERTRERVPLDWAATQNNLVVALWSLGERESGTARLDDAVAACREALKEYEARLPEAWPNPRCDCGALLRDYALFMRRCFAAANAAAMKRDELLDCCYAKAASTTGHRFPDRYRQTRVQRKRPRHLDTYSA